MPLESGGVKVMSIGFFVEEDAAVVWRGPMLHKALKQFLEDVDWGELDFLLVDLPPGTGDVSMTLAQLLPQAKFVIVTTPQAPRRRSRGARPRWPHKVDLEIGGVIENMAGFVDAERRALRDLRRGRRPGARRRARRPAARKVPLTMPLREQSDAGEPLVVADPDDPASQAIRQAARGLVAIFPRGAAGLPGRRGRRGRRRLLRGAQAGRHEPPDGLAICPQDAVRRRSPAVHRRGTRVQARSTPVDTSLDG